MAIEMTRGRVLAYRHTAQGLDREDGGAGAPADVAVLGLGLQDTPAGSARYALAARLADPAAAADPGPDLVVVWSVRGAPHLHRVADLPDLAAALWPLDDEDALVRIGNAAPKMRAAGVGGLDGLRTAVRAVRETVTGPVTKGEVSAAVTAAVPEPMTMWCPACGATHVHNQVLMLAGLPGGVRIVPGGPPTTLDALTPRPPAPRAARGTEALVRAYLRLLGPAGPDEVAAWLGVRREVAERVWPREGLVPARLDGRTVWLPEDAPPAPARPADHVRLLPPGDPWLQARDRALLVPGAEDRKRVWRAISGPGVILAGGEVVGLWRAKAAGRARLDVTLSGFDGLTAGVRRRAEAEAERIAAARGMRDVRVRHEG